VEIRGGFHSLLNIGNSILIILKFTTTIPYHGANHYIISIFTQTNPKKDQPSQPKP